MDLLQLQYFVAIAEQGSMSGAARRLYVSQPNLSVSLSRLEDELGVALFDRRRGKIDLTESGQIFLKYVKKMFDDLDTGLSRIRTFSSDSSAQLSVATSVTDLLGSVILSMGCKVKDMRIKQIACQNDQVCNLVLNEEADVGIVFGESIVNGLEYFQLGESERVAIVNDRHPLASRKAVNLSDLKDYNFVLNRGRDDEQLFQYIGSKYGIYPLVSCECDDILLEAAVQYENDYVSISTLPSYLKLLRRSPDMPLKPILIADTLPPSRVRMVRRVGHHLSRMALKFETAATAYYKKEWSQAAEFRREFFDM